MITHLHFEKDDKKTIIKFNDLEIGGEKSVLMAGPCAIESEEQIIQYALELKKMGVNILRAGAFKPRTNPYDFQGLQIDGLKYLKEAKKISNMPVVTELTSLKYIDYYLEDIDIIQVGSRNMQNYELLKELGKVQIPILLKRGMCATYNEWLMAAEYILNGGNPNVILCERGIRSFESYTRNTLDIQAIPIMKELTHLPIIIDPSHSSGKSSTITSMSLAGIIAGADGVIIETHKSPKDAICDGKQSITFEHLNTIINSIKEIEKFKIKY